MRKLQQSLKLLLNNARSSATLAAERSLSASTSAAQPHPRPLSRLILDSLRSWRSPNGAPSRSSYAAFWCPAMKKAMASTRLSIGLHGLLDRGVSSLKMSLQRRRFAHRMNFSLPQRSWSHLMLTPEGVVLGLIGANVAVFVLWRIADPTFMRKNFMLSLDNVKNGRLHTLLTSAFSHADADHIFTNMIGLYFFGQSIANLFGPEFLLKMYISGALGGSIFFLVHTALLSRSLEGKRSGSDPSRIYALGASAAVNAIILLDVFLFPMKTVYLNILIPVPAFLVGAVLIGTDLWRIKKGDSRISGSAHLGGAAVAAIVCARFKGWV